RPGALAGALECERPLRHLGYSCLYSLLRNVPKAVSSASMQTPIHESLSQARYAGERKRESSRLDRNAFVWDTYTSRHRSPAHGDFHAAFLDLVCLFGMARSYLSPR